MDYYQYQYCFDVSRQFAERGEACLLRLSLTHVRGGSQDEERVLTTARPLPLPLPHPRPRGGRAAVQSVSDCQKHTLYYQYYYCSPSRIGEQPSAKFTSSTSTTTIVYRGMYYTSTRNRMEERLHSYYNLKCDKAIFNTFGSLRGFSHLIMEVDCMEHSPEFSLNSGSYPVTNRSAR